MTYKNQQEKDLYQQRFKIIAPYPNSPFELGQIVEAHLQGNCFVGTRDAEGVVHNIIPHLYPELFKQLHWWEERKEEEMPDYVTVAGYGYNHFSVPSGVYKVKRHFFPAYGSRNCCLTDEVLYKGVPEPISYAQCRPATEQEYINSRSPN